KNDTIEISRAKLLEKTIKGEIDFLVGTHSLIQDKVKFNNLGLIILDEQHRFGIEQRAKLVQKPKVKSKTKIPHLLSMTATPIPRTLALTIYGDLDLSLIDELPKGRKKIITKVMGQNDRQEAYSFIKKEVKKGRQVFVICPRIEPTNNETEINNQNISLGITSGWATVKAVKEEYEKLSEKIFPDLNIAMLHSKIALKEKERIMKNFKYGKTDILVSTSVIEVGIDIPNASVMIIEGADRFGLAQLHQFRGRVGRAKHQSFCFLFADSQSKKTHQRLKALINCEDGFALAEKDLIIRGPGSFFGTKQWGIPDLAMKAISNISLVEKAREIAKEYLDFKKYPIVLERLKAFQEKVHLE
ncbi:MAG: DNA helicase RecG, partial [Candidatus Pacebacteria bacterium]|nr:DNA helicase RecG [Candidatus Paceibacterota bacterium]